MSDHKPNFFIIGAPKCGTSAMYVYLADHPSIFMSLPKEPHYFNTDLDDPLVKGQESLEDYLSLFAEAGESEVIGEASIFYLFSRVALDNIRAFATDPKFLVMVRNPVDLVYSFHSTLLFSGQETEKDFETAWRARDDREGSPLLHYGEVGKLGKQLERAFDRFPRRSFHVVVYDDFRADPKREYLETLSFLGLGDDGRDDFGVVNPNHTYRSKILERVLKAAPNPRRIKQLLGIERIGALAWLANKNIKFKPRPSLSRELESELREFFRADVELLSTLLGRDLSHWTKQPE